MSELANHDEYTNRSDPSDMLVESWVNTASLLREATLPFATDAEQKALIDCEYEDFWDLHSRMLEDIEVRQPGSSEEILLKLESMSEEQLAAEQKYFEEVELPDVKRGAFRRGLMKALHIGIRL